MPKADSKSTLLRQWTLLRKLTVNRASQGVAGRWDKASELQQKLAEEGFEVSVRTVQRDLKELMEIFPLEVNDQNPKEYGWRWQKDVQFDIPGMTVSEALMLNLSEMHLKGLMPIGFNSRLSGLFNIAKKKLRDASNVKDNLYKAWLEKIHIAPATLNLIAPTIDPEVHNAVYQALFENKKIEAKYTPMNASASKVYLLNPLGLINRGNVYYLVASAWDYEDAHLYALHRFKEIYVLKESINTPKDFSLDTAISSGLAEFRVNNETIKLVLKCDEGIINYLKESPISRNQTIREKNNNFFVTAEVNNTWELQFWILSYSDNLEVIEPSSLRQQIKDKLMRAAKQYG